MTQSPKALLVDAHHVNSNVIETLRRREVIVDVAHDAATASASLERGGYCGVVLDAPDGDDVLRFMAERAIDLPTVVIRGSVSEMPEGEQVKVVLPTGEPALLECALLGLCGVDK